VSAFAEALLAELSDDQLAALADRLRPFLRDERPAGDGWLRGARAIADYLGCPRSRVYALVSAGRLGAVRPGEVRMIHVTANGDRRELPPGTTLADLITALTESARGIAAAVNGEVVPRRAWPDTPLADGSVVEIVTAVQGG